MHNEMIVIIDFGGQYSQLIARRVRENNVYCEILPYDTTIEKVKSKNPKGIIFSGGPNSVYENDSPKMDKEIFNLNVPVLGICYGHQFMAMSLNGEVKSGNSHEYGVMEIELNNSSEIFSNIENKNFALMSHTDYVSKIPEGFKVIGKTSNCEVAAMENIDKKFYGVQFHPEVKHTKFGEEFIKNFLFNICKIEKNWTMDSFVKEKVNEIKNIAKDKKVICALSGGVDSSVAATLVYRAIGENLTCIFVDHGLLRKNESEDVYKTFKERLNMNLIKVDARERFLNKLKGIDDPEKKRKIIGEEFINVFEEEANKIGEVDFLVQGTIYPDIVESGTKTSATIKSHHNVGGLPEKMNLKLIEPLRELFKDEVRKVGEELGIPKELVWRQPFPGPGLGIRILGEISEDKIKIVQDADYIFREEIKNAGLEGEIWQYFACLPNIKSVGVMGDSRTYSYTIVLRGVTSTDGMTSEWARIPYEILDKISKRITNEVEEVNRVVYDITSKPPATIEWE